MSWVEILITSGLVFLILILVAFLIYMIFEWRNDDRWEAWLAAHREWEKTRIGEGPTTEDFGWKPPSRS
jgi:hypothetical protein